MRLRHHLTRPRGQFPWCWASFPNTSHRLPKLYSTILSKVLDPWPWRSYGKDSPETRFLNYTFWDRRTLVVFHVEFHSGVEPRASWGDGSRVVCFGLFGWETWLVWGVELWRCWGSWILETRSKSFSLVRFLLHLILELRLEIISWDAGFLNTDEKHFGVCLLDFTISEPLLVERKQVPAFRTSRASRIRQSNRRSGSFDSKPTSSM